MSRPKTTSICRVSGCINPNRSKGYCKSHYARVLRGSRLDTPLRILKPRRPCAILGCSLHALSRKKHCKIHYTKQIYDGWKNKRDSSFYYNIKARALKLGIPFELPKESIEIPEKCPILGIPLVYGIGVGKSSDNSPSVDRIIPEKGYVPGNVHVISFKANRIKNNATPEELMRVAVYFRDINKRGIPPEDLE